MTTEVRTAAHADEAEAAVHIVGEAMLAEMSPERVEGWLRWADPERTHLAFDDGRPAGTAKWFPTTLSTPGGEVEAAAVTAVAVLPTHRRRGHLTRLMEAQLDHVAGEGRPVAVLVAAEWGIYGRFGYGPATEACAWELDTATASFTDPPAGTVELVQDAASVRADIEALHDSMSARRPGVITRDGLTWDIIAGVAHPPGGDPHAERRRTAVWRPGPGGAPEGVIRYRVENSWDRNRPRGTATVDELFARTPQVERELWRHLCSLDWIATVRAGGRPVDDPLPLWLRDGRAAAQVDRFDHVWARILDLPAALGARLAGTTGSVSVEVTDRLGRAGGRWHLTAGAGEPIEATSSSSEADLVVPAAALGALYLGGHSAVRLQDAGWIEERTEGATRALGAMLGWPVAPWVPTDF
jgi:predicted acetyltransferase